MSYSNVQFTVKGLRSVIADQFLGGFIGLPFDLPTRVIQASQCKVLKDSLMDCVLLEAPEGLARDRLFYIQLALKELEILGYGKFKLKGQEGICLPENHVYKEAFERIAAILNYKGSLR
jgi:hypothetical protein